MTADAIGKKAATRARLLVVEDDVNLLEAVRVVLELARYSVTTANNGLQALTYLRNATVQPDLILSDIMMPQMDGFELLSTLRSETAWVTTPFIFLTAKGERTDLQRGKRLGVDDYLIKPFDAEDLLIAVDARLKRQRALNSAQANAISAVKRNILTILNHEFRTPLTFVVAYADMLDQGSTEALGPDDLLAFLKGVSSGASRLRRLIENFILLVELETGDAQRTFDWRRSLIADARGLLDEVCERTVRLVQPERRCELVVGDPFPAFVADREYLIIALSQLVGNALKFSAPDTPLVLGAHSGNDEIHLWVQDYGRGIEESEAAAIWDLFYQVDRTRHEDQGTGSGLAIVRGIVRMHGGRVRLASKPGAGSTFTLILPRAAAT